MSSIASPPVDLILFRRHTGAMSSMFDKLGDMLNECLEKGEIPQNPPKRKYYRENSLAGENSSPAQEGGFAAGEPAAEKEPITLPRDVEQALDLLGLAGTGQQESTLALPSLAQVRAAYAQLLKEAHPDTAQEEITSAQAAQRIDQLTNAFNRVREWYRERE